jgi:hypothetical protein
VNMPKPECRWGYTEAQVNKIMGERVDEFRSWMDGQTVGFCQGRAYDHDKREYYEVCDGKHHGVVVYSCDIERFLGI